MRRGFQDDVRETEVIRVLRDHSFVLETSGSPHVSHDRYISSDLPYMVLLFDAGNWEVVGLGSSHGEFNQTGETAEELHTLLTTMTKHNRGDAAPGSKNALAAQIESYLRRYYKANPTIEVQHIDGGNFRVRVGSGSASWPRYFAVKVTEQHR